MSIGFKDIEYVAALSKFELSEKEKSTFTEQLREVMLYIEKLNELDTEDVDPLINPLDIKNVFREDELQESIRHEKCFFLAPVTKDYFFKVPKVLE